MATPKVAIDKSQELVTGTVHLKLYKGNNPLIRFTHKNITFEEDDVYDQADAVGFIKINALRLRLSKTRDRKAFKNS